MNREELLKSCMKEVILDNWKSKLGYPFNHKDLEELENIINYYEQETQQLHNKIDKAIEFIKKAQYDDELKSYVYGLNATGTRKLLEILKDSDVDE